jgi:hypothetical protein
MDPSICPLDFSRWRRWFCTPCPRLLPSRHDSQVACYLSPWAYSHAPSLHSIWTLNWESSPPVVLNSASIARARPKRNLYHSYLYAKQAFIVALIVLTSSFIPARSSLNEVLFANPLNFIHFRRLLHTLHLAYRLSP